jgi:hypothetical protein
MKDWIGLSIREKANNIVALFLRHEQQQAKQFICKGYQAGSPERKV